jgi:hypothetical protein
MLKLTDLKPGDIIKVDDDGVMREGVVLEKDIVRNLVLVDNGIQEFWYSPEQIHPLPLDENQLLRLGFTKEEADGSVKYKRDSFRLVTPKKGDFSSIEMWWREDRRHFNYHISVHELQNRYHDMTKVPLELP